MLSQKLNSNYLAACIVIVLISVAGTAFSYDWPQFNGDPQHSGNNTEERTITDWKAMYTSTGQGMARRSKRGAGPRLPR